MENQQAEEIMMVSMNIILKAGDARVSIKQALKAVEDNQYDEANAKLAEAKDQIREAHQLQTELIQGEARGEKIEVTVLFSHAQDTLMTIYSEYNLALNIVAIMSNIDARIKKIEEVVYE